MGVYIGRGNNIAVGGKWWFVVENGQNECASQCTLTEKCVAWTFNISSSSCWLKSDDSIKVNADVIPKYAKNTNVKDNTIANGIFF